jgi:hypothetical protein
VLVVVVVEITHPVRLQQLVVLAVAALVLLKMPAKPLVKELQILVAAVVVVLRLSEVQMAVLEL